MTAPTPSTERPTARPPASQPAARATRPAGPPQTVVAAVDLATQSEDVVRWAHRLAGASGGRLTVVTVWPPAQRPDLSDGNRARRALQQLLAASLPAAGAGSVTLQVIARADVGDLIDALLDTAAESRADLLVVGRRDGARRHSLGRTVARLLERAPLPVAVVGEGDGERRTERVVVGVDESEPAVAALQWTVTHCAALGATVRAVHAWECTEQYPIQTWSQTFDDQYALARQEVERMVGRLGSSGDAVTRDAVHGRAVDVLEDEARDADLIVVGRTGTGHVWGRLLGSVSQHVARVATVPVIVVPDSVHTDLLESDAR